MKYKLKHDCIEAFQYLGKIVNDDGVFCVPDWAVKEYKSGKLYEYENIICFDNDGITYHVNKSDYVIHETDGKLYVCNKKTFEILFKGVL